ncbi:hypothetical protein KI387_025291, partial [Taxus chinensis]
MVNRCCLGQTGILKIIQALSENCSLQELSLAANIHENDTIFNFVGGADRTSTACCGEEVATTQNYHEECPEIRAIEKSIQLEIPISVERVPFLDCVNSHECNGPVDHRCHSISTIFSSNDTVACAGNTTESIKERGFQQSYKKDGRNCDEYDVADSEDDGRPEGVNHSSLEDDCASSSQSLGH